MTTSKKPVRLAVVGGNRGFSVQNALSVLPELIELTAICDLNDQLLQKWKTQYPEIAVYTDYSELLDNPNVDAVLLATPLTMHAQQAIQALKAGKHVLSEVIAAHTLEDAWELVETVEQTKLIYMLAGNYCYMRPNMMIQHMIQQNLFGPITFVEGAYIHDCRSLTHYSDGSLTWRGELNRDYNAMNYPTHSLGPLAQWLGINRTDELDYMSTCSTRNGSVANHFREHFGDSHPGANPEYWKQGDCTITTIRTKKGIVISLRLDWSSGRPHNMTHYGLQGQRGAYLSARTEDEHPLIWLENRSPGSSADGSAQWEPLWNYAGQYEHPLWQRWLQQAEEAGHGGGDFFVIHEFASAIHENRRPAIDVYDAAVWSSVFPLSARSIAGKGATMQFPNFAKNLKKPDFDESGN